MCIGRAYGNRRKGPFLRRVRGAGRTEGSFGVRWREEKRWRRHCGVEYMVWEKVRFDVYFEEEVKVESCGGRELWRTVYSLLRMPIDVVLHQ